MTTIETGAEKTILGRRTGAHYAKLVCDGVAQLDATHATAADAKAALLDECARLAEHRLTRRYLFCADGTVLCVYYAGFGWAYDIVGPHRQPCSVMMNYATTPTLARVMEAARDHAAQSYGGVVGA